MPVVAGAAAVIGGWAGGAAAAVGASAAVAGAVATIAEGVVIGVVTGAVIGAATSAITGGNILDGALKGAAIGGLTAGVTTGLSMAFSGAAEATSGLGVNAGDGVAQGVSSGSVSDALVQGGTGAVDAAAPNALVQGGTGAVDIPASVGNTGSSLQNVATNTDSQMGNPLKGLLSSVKDAAGTKETIAAGVEGAFKGIGQVAAAKMDADSAEEEAKREAEIIQKAKEDNQVGEFVAQVANITVPDWWNKYIDPSLTGNQPANPNGNPVNPNNQPTAPVPTQGNPIGQGLLSGGATA